VDGWRDSCTNNNRPVPGGRGQRKLLFGIYHFCVPHYRPENPFFLLSSLWRATYKKQESTTDARSIGYIIQNKAHKIITANIESVSLLRMSTVRKYQCMCGAFEAQVTGEPVLAVSIFCACRCDGYHSGWCHS